MSIRLALAQWTIGAPHDFAEFAARVTAEIAKAAAAGARIVVLPEYLALELASTFAAEIRADIVATLTGLQPLHEAWAALFGTLAREHRIHLLAGTFLCAQPNGRFRNRAHLFAPGGGAAFQDKLTLTAFEKHVGVIEPGDELRVFDTEFGRVAINVCYDAEFPLYARAQREAGARLLLVPSCTDTEAGATRVRVGCMARALENRFYVAQSVTAGAAPENPALDMNTGNAAVYAPSDRGLPANGVLALAPAGQTWTIVDVDLDLLEATAGDAQVTVPDDWHAQTRAAVVRACVEKI